MSVPSYPFHSLPLKLLNKEIDFPFSPLKLPNKGMEEYSKIILFIPFHFIPFPPPKRGLSFTLSLFLFPIQNISHRTISFFLISSSSFVKVPWPTAHHRLPLTASTFVVVFLHSSLQSPLRSHHYFCSISLLSSPCTKLSHT